MPIPVAMDRLLRQQNVAYDVIATVDTADRATIGSCLLHDGSHRLLVLFPTDCLLDLSAVCRHSGRQWQALPPVELAQLCRQHQLATLPAVPAAFGLATLVDKRLLDSTDIVFSAGNGHLLRLHAQQFRQSLDGVAVADIAIPLTCIRRSGLEQMDDVADISRAVASFTQLRMTQRLEETLEIAPLPATAQRIITLRADPYAGTRQLTDIVEMDPALAAQVVSWAASPYYAAPGSVTSVHDAIVRVLGFDLVLNLALGLSLGRTVDLPADTPRGFTPYWQQAVYTATAMEALIGAIPPARRASVGLSYLTGLLHNFGFLLLAEIFPPHFSACCRYLEANPTVGYAPVERHLLGVTRDQLAGWLMRLWSMPEEVTLGLRYQSEPDYAGPHHRYANLALVAKRLLRLHGIGDGPLLPVPEEIYERLYLDPAVALQAIQHVVDASDAINTMAGDLAGFRS